MFHILAQICIQTCIYVMSLSIQGLNNRTCVRIGLTVTGLKRLNDPTTRVLAAVAGNAEVLTGMHMRWMTRVVASVCEGLVGMRAKHLTRVIASVRKTLAAKGSHKCSVDIVDINILGIVGIEPLEIVRRVYLLTYATVLLVVFRTVWVGCVI